MEYNALALWFGVQRFRFVIWSTTLPLCDLVSNINFGAVVLSRQSGSVGLQNGYFNALI
ncbi:MAG: hypothetical protein KAI83_14385 [Thiomargarita sp.]|nr:hypothetical protein [Thiomargarita sp.]